MLKHNFICFTFCTCVFPCEEDSFWDTYGTDGITSNIQSQPFAAILQCFAVLFWHKFFVYKASTLANIVGMLSSLSARVVYTVVIQFSEQGITVPRGIHFYSTMPMVFVLYELFCSRVSPG